YPRSRAGQPRQAMAARSCPFLTHSTVTSASLTVTRAREPRGVPSRTDQHFGPRDGCRLTSTRAVSRTCSGDVDHAGCGRDESPPRGLSLHVRTTLRAGSILAQFDPDDQLETSPRLTCAGWSAIPHL